MRTDTDTIATLRRRLLLAPGRAETHRRLAQVSDEAQPMWWQRAAASDAGCVVSRIRLAAIHVRRREAGAATRALNAALALSPSEPPLLFELGALLKAAGLGWLARAIYRRLLVVEPQHFDAWCNLSNLDLATGDHVATRRAIIRARALRGVDPLPHKKLLGLVLYAEADPDAIYAEHLAAMRALGLTSLKAPSVLRRPARPQRRIGFVSSDFTDHPVAGNIRSLFRHRPSDWHTFVYANVDSPDATTDWFRGRADVWRDITAVSHEEALSAMRADDLDAVVFLAGRFNANWFFVRERVAPVQISFFDGATSASPVIDYWITDGVLNPEASRERFLERLVRIPTFYNYEPPEESPPVSLRRGEDEPTFGVFNNPAKITPFVVELWGRILRVLPSARLVLKYGNAMLDPAASKRISDLFASAGIDPVRLLFKGASANRADHLGSMGDVDVALDTFPFTGVTTTFECLWMGVPVVTLAGATFIQRGAASILVSAGLGELVATDAAGYVRTVVDVATAPDRLKLFRQTLRERVVHSPLCDGPGYAKALASLMSGLLA